MSDTTPRNNPEDLRSYLHEVMAIQTETIRRIVSDDNAAPLDVAALLEDVANQFLDISDEIREFAQGYPLTLPPSIMGRPRPANRA